MCVVLACALAIGLFLRLCPAQIGRGFDEARYRDYVNKLDAVGPLNYPKLIDAYIAEQRQPSAAATLPPTRVLFVGCGWLWHKISGTDAWSSVRWVSCVASILMLAVSGTFAFRLGGKAPAFAVLALMSCAPTQIQMSRHAWIDGFFALWAVLCLWALSENLRAPNRPGWLFAYGASLAAMVMTKENAFFVFVALVGILVANHWLHLGRATIPLYAVTVIGPAVGLAAVVVASGGVHNFVETFRLNVAKSQVLDYAIKFGDGPWHRYLVEILLVSPVVWLLAVGNIFTVKLDDKPRVYLLLFVVITYAVMAQVRYGMNLRYGNMWDMPLRWLVFSQIVVLTARIPPRFRNLAVAAVVALVCAHDLVQYEIIFLRGKVYDPIPPALAHSLNILK
jgi:4-amino-4-deoxy-L-arabinose transferase-like glycosyltransferase